MSSQAMLIFKRNLAIYQREKTFRQDIKIPLIIYIILLIGKNKSDAVLIGIGTQFLPLSLMSVTRGVTTSLIDEKASRQKEIQKIMGVSQHAYVIGWLMTNLFRFLIIVVPYMLLLIITNVLQGAQGKIAMSLILYGFAQFSSAYFFSTFIQDAKTGGDITFFLNLVGSFLTELMGVDYFQQNDWPNYIFSLLPSFAFSAISNYNGTNQFGTNKGNFGKTDAYYMLAADIALYMLAYLYFDQVIQGEYGTKKSPLFIFGVKSKDQKNQEEQSLQNMKEPLLSETTIDDKGDFSSAIYHEKIDGIENYRKAVEITGLFKKFEQVQAVNGISLCLYEYQILTLLGHNGAGKTTTLSLLTGLLNKDSGIIRYYGKNSDADLDEIRKITGICPQADVCYPNLTVEEHLEFYGRIKGVVESQLQQEVNTVIEKCALTYERKKLSKDLSGGNRRKLCLGMAVIGGSKIIFLDEPTSGMDPVSRRKIWDILKQLKLEGKSIVLTTHHLDEAEVLSERIAIMARGKLLTVGSSNFVKRNFGIGYHLNIFNNGYSKADWTKQVEDIKDFVLRNVKGSAVDPMSSEDFVSFALRFDSKDSFQELFLELEKDPQIIIDIQMNTLEEAFVNIGMDEEKFMRETRRYSQVQVHPSSDDLQVNVNEAIDNSDLATIIPPPCVTYQPNFSFGLQVYGCLLRSYYRTNVRRFLCSIVIPVAIIMVLGAISLSNRDGYWQVSATTQIYSAFVVALSFQASGAGLPPILERQEKLKYAMNVMGCRQIPYWIANLIYDYTLGTLIVTIYVVALVIFSFDYLISFTVILSVYLTSLAYTCLAYLVSWMFNEFLTAQKAFSMIMIVGIWTIPLSLFSTNSDSTWVQYTTAAFFPSIPPYIIFSLHTPTKGDTDVTFNGISNAPSLYIFIQIAQSFVYFAATILMDYRDSKETQPVEIPEPADMDSDVKNEQIRVQSRDCTDRVRAIKISKTYDNGYVAVKGTSFGIEQGQVLGLLGPNGAGKSTTFNMLTARLKPSSGEIFLMGQPARKGNAALYQHVGICPQFDVVWADITPVQHLTFFAYIKGLKGQDVQDAVNYFIQVMQLDSFVTTPSNRLSGGNKRKLCVATALIGGTNMQFFDEPSSGVDPIARKFLRNTILQGLKNQKGAIVLTTHTMDEAEQLCHKIAIQVNGQFACMGSPQHLKQKFGDGYRCTVDVTFEAIKEEVTQMVLERFPGTTVIPEAVNNRLTFKLPQGQFKMSSAFGFFYNELQIDKRFIKDFQISQCSLEAVFMYFASLQQAIPAEIQQAPKTRRRGILGLFKTRERRRR